MKKNTKIMIIGIVVALIVITVVVLMITNNKNYSDEYSATDLYNQVTNSFSTDGGTNILDDDVIFEFTEEDLPYLKDYTVVKAKNAKNINEIGIFKVEDGKTKDMKALLENYVANLQQAYRAMDYFPEELEKIDCATVKVFGNYVVYSFLNEKDTENFYNAIENTIKK